MKTFNKTLIAAATITTLGLAAAPTALALDASASLATSYLWRGTELGNGDSALAVDVSGSSGAVSYGLWVSSGDASSTEYDIYASYGGSIGELGYSVGYASYNYPSTGVGFDDAAEYTYGVSYGPFSISHFDGKDSEAYYTAISYTAGAFTFTYGDATDVVDAVEAQDAVAAVDAGVDVTTNALGQVTNVTYVAAVEAQDAVEAAAATTETRTHFDIAYSVTDALTLTVSESSEADTIVVASYSLPF